MSAAKAKNEVATQEDIYAGLSPEELAMMRKLTGQSNNDSFERAPNFKINYTPKKDKEGNKVEIGNFVVGQVTKQVDGAKVVESIGKDFGPNPEITIFKVATQYSYYNDSKELRCSSQLITDKSETPVGSTMKYECNSGKCPRRSKDAIRGEKCSCQYVVYMEPEDGTRCLMYVKGASFMPFKAYLDEVGQDIICFYPTVLKTKEKSQGSVDYFEIYPEIDKTRPYSAEVRKENLKKLAAVSKDIQDFKASQAVATKQVTYSEAEVVTAGADEGFDDITF